MGAGTLLAGKAAFDLYAGAQQSKAEKKAAKETRELTKLEAQAQYDEDTKVLASQEAGAAARGAVGSSTDVMFEGLKNRKTNYLNTIYKGEVAANKQEQSAKNTMLQTGASLLSTAASGYKDGAWSDWGWSKGE